MDRLALKVKIIGQRSKVNDPLVWACRRSNAVGVTSIIYQVNKLISKEDYLILAPVLPFSHVNLPYRIVSYRKDGQSRRAGCVTGRNVVHQSGV